jgi:hypothetical protein
MSTACFLVVCSGPLPASQVHSLSSLALVDQSTRFAPGGAQVPSTIEGGVLVGQYIRITKVNFPFGAGSQFASFAVPGESAWRYMSAEPSLLVMNLLRWLNS